MKSSERPIVWIRIYCNAIVQVFLMKLALTGFLHCIWGMEDKFLLTVVKLVRRGGKG